MKLRVKGDEYDLSRLTLGEASAIEGVTGKPITALQNDASVGTIQALVALSICDDAGVRLCAIEDAPALFAKPYSCLKPLIALLAIVNPIGVVPFFIHFTQNFTREQRRRTIVVSSFTAFVVIALSARASAGRKPIPAPSAVQAVTSTTPSPISSRDTSNVPPPRSKTSRRRFASVFVNP